MRLQISCKGLAPCHHLPPSAAHTVVAAATAASNDDNKCVHLKTMFIKFRKHRLVNSFVAIAGTDIIFVCVCV